ncbi:hypothetical protein [Filimonas effusa]|uniref:Uncharacterized protein n=1 Tax=Filimonas effusa TaxID=2508721 RepID=A0A4Q1D3V0_9BACT|nr:hypothetical protein [Filimonas effusa]RXK83008.1 hypothetical protein ESB13_12855 [Filimonas effusa]
MSYTHLAYLKPGKSIDLETLENNIAARYEGMKNSTKPVIVDEAGMLRISFNSYNFYITLVSASHVAVEARETAEQVDKDWAENAYDKGALKESTIRLDFYGDADPEMEYFNDSLFILEEIEKTGDTIIFHSN